MFCDLDQKKKTLNMQTCKVFVFDVEWFVFSDDRDEVPRDRPRHDSDDDSSDEERRSRRRERERRDRERERESRREREERSKEAPPGKNLTFNLCKAHVNLKVYTF